MSFGRNPHVPKAEMAEQKAVDATDQDARRRAHLEAARLWDRAAERERPGKNRDAYLDNAERNRADAEGEDAPPGNPDHGVTADPPAPGNVIPFPEPR